MESGYLLSQAIRFFSLILIGYGCGLLVVYKGVKVNYTRKILHFSLFLIPIFLNYVFPYEMTFGLFLIGSVIAMSTLILYIKPLRKRVALFQMMFNAIDRPEDRPYTLLWLSTQVVVGWLVIIPSIMLFVLYGLESLILIPVLITAIGDGLAEPVGVRFGRHKYKVKALTSNRTYYRSLEGSSCVFIASLLIVGVHYAHFSPPQFIAAMVLMPVVMTLTEAFSPHTWDSPTLFLAGYLLLFGITFI